MKKEDKSEISSSLSSPVPRAGIEPARLLRTLDFESSASTNSATWAFFNHSEAQPIGIAHTKVIVFSN